MKATPELLQKALRNLEIGLSPEIATKILATVRLLDEKGAEANLIDFSLIEACYSEKPQSEPLPSDKIDLSLLEVNDTVVLRDGYEKKVSRISEPKVSNKYEVDLGFDDDSTAFYMNDGSFWVDRSYCLEDIVKIIKPN